MSYVVNAAELLEKIKEIVDEGMDSVEISFAEADEDLPAAICFKATVAGSADGWEDFEEIPVISF